MSSDTTAALSSVGRLLDKNEEFERKYGMNFKDLTEELDRARSIPQEVERDWRRWDMLISELQPDDTYN